MLHEIDHRIVYDSKRCTQCGSCFSECPVNALHLIEGNDVFGIDVDPATCTSCKKCVRVCPAGELPERPLTEEDFQTFKKAVLAHAANPVLRKESTSGGVARTLAYTALKSGWVDAVYCAVKSEQAPFAEGAFLTSPAEVAQISNSIYCAFPFNRNLAREVGGLRIKRLLYIGTNCQIQGAERYFKNTGIELIKVAIICKQQKTKAYTRWARRMLRQAPGETAPIAYRGNGWPGALASQTATYRNFFRPFSMQIWRVPGCRFCPNAWGSGSDILLADPWNLVDAHSGNPGLTMTVLRTDRALELWATASDLLIEERPLTAAEVQKSMDWPNYRQKQKRIPFFLGQEPSLMRSALYGAHELQRSLYGWVFDTLRPPEVVEKILNRTLKR